MWKPIAMKDEHGKWLGRVMRAAEELDLVPRGLSEYELTLSTSHIYAIEYWKDFPRTNATHTEVTIPIEHSHIFDNFANEYKRMYPDNNVNTRAT
jgi:hypothetical protein